MPVKSSPYPEWPAWTEAKFWAFIRSGLRAKWSRWPAKYAVLAAAKRNYSGDNPRQKYEYKCAKCKKHYPQKEVSVDHIEPVGQLRSFDDLATFCQRLFVGPDKLQVLCKKDHDAKTKLEGDERRANNKNKDTE
jgi:hypothetical protein